MQTKCQGHNISRLLTWVLFYSVSLLFKQHRKSRKCNINFYTAFIFSPMELFKIQGFFMCGAGTRDVILYVTSQSHIWVRLLEENQRCWVFCWVWTHCVFCGKWCDNGHDVGVDLTTRTERQEESVFIKPGSCLGKNTCTYINIWIFSLGGQSCMHASKNTFLGIHIHTWTQVSIGSCA